MTHPRFSRRTALSFGGAALAAPFLTKATQAQTGDFRILAWEGYADEAWVAAFEAATGAKASITCAGSVDEMFAKAQGGNGADFDVVSIDTSLSGRYTDAGLLQPIDLSQVPNAANLAPAFAHVGAVTRDRARMAFRSPGVRCR